MIFSLSSLPLRADKSSEKIKLGKPKRNERTFKNDSAVQAPEVSKTLRVLFSFDTNKAGPIDEDIEPVCMPKVLSRVDFESIPICLWRRR
jgi:hypothetical protein